jgi:hypothetical protein
MADVKYPEVKSVKLIGEDGNAFSILARVMKAMRVAGLSKEVQDAYYKEATSGDYDHLLRITISWVKTK